MNIAKQIKKLAGESVIYGIAGVFSRFISLFLFPVYSKILAPSEYGIMGMYNSTFFFIVVLVCFAMDSATFRFFFDSHEKHLNQKKTFSNWFFFQLGLSALFILIILGFNKIGSRLIFNNLKDSTTIIKWLAVLIVLYGMPTILEAWYRLHRKPVAAVIFTLGTTLLNIGITVICIVKLKLGIFGFIYGQIAGYLAGTIYGLIVLRKWIKVKYFDFSLLKNMLKYALPLLPAGLASSALYFATNYYLKSRLDFTQLGLYSIGNTLASSLALITMAFAQAWSPFAFSIAKNESATKTYSAVFTLYCITLSLACLVFSIFLPDILRLLANKNYYDADIVGSILCFNIFFVSTAVIGMTGNGIIKKTGPYAKAVILGAVISLIFIVIFANYFGKEGAAFGMLLGQLIVPIYVFASSQKYYPIPFAFPKVISIISLSVFLAIGTKVFISSDYSFTSFLFKAGIIIIFLIGCIYFFKSEFNIAVSNFRKLKKVINVSKEEIDIYNDIVDSKSEINSN